MSKKYTMKEFKEMFDKVKLQVLEEETQEHQEKIDNPMAGFIMSMLSTITVKKLEEKLFGEADDNE